MHLKAFVLEESTYMSNTLFMSPVAIICPKFINIIPLYSLYYIPIVILNYSEVNTHYIHYIPVTANIKNRCSCS